MKIRAGMGGRMPLALYMKGIAGRLADFVGYDGHISQKYIAYAEDAFRLLYESRRFLKRRLLSLVVQCKPGSFAVLGVDLGWVLFLT
jgi:hypothetical protein